MKKKLQVRHRVVHPKKALCFSILGRRVEEKLENTFFFLCFKHKNFVF